MISTHLLKVTISFFMFVRLCAWNKAIPNGELCLKFGFSKICRRISILFEVGRK